VRYDIRPLVGDAQRTSWSAALVDGRIEARSVRATGEDGGDGTVPRVSAQPHELLDGWRNAAFYAEQHASLQNDDEVFDHVVGVLRATPLDRRDVFPAGDVPVALEVDDTTLDEPLVVRARPRDPGLTLIATATPVGAGDAMSVSMLEQGDGWYAATLPALPAGDYRVRVHGPAVRPVTGIASVIDLVTLEQAAA
jgi:hypothetical protein